MRSHSLAQRKWGESEALAEAAGINYGTAQTYGTVARAYEFATRVANLTHRHHFVAMAVPASERRRWLQRAVDNEWSTNELVSSPISRR
jgi:hypothetical protein